MYEIINGMKVIAVSQVGCRKLNPLPGKTRVECMFVGHPNTCKINNDRHTTVLCSTPPRVFLPDTEENRAMVVRNRMLEGSR